MGIGLDLMAQDLENKGFSKEEIAERLDEHINNHLQQNRVRRSSEPYRNERNNRIFMLISEIVGVKGATSLNPNRILFQDITEDHIKRAGKIVDMIYGVQE